MIKLNLIAGSADSTVRLWDLEAGIPLACSRNLRHTVRALSVDNEMLVNLLTRSAAIQDTTPTFHTGSRIVFVITDQLSVSALALTPGRSL